ncbi:MAG: hypothetical protein ABI318_09775 [Chthoniobacteraceae bacterium]
MNRRALCSIATASLLVAGCDRQPATVMETAPRPYAPTSLAQIEKLETGTLLAEIDAFERSPSAVHGARVRKTFAEIDLEFAELNALLATKGADVRADSAGKLAELRAQQHAAQLRFQRLEVLASPKASEVSDQQAGKGTAEKIGEKVDEAVQKVGNKLRDAGEVIRDQTR